MKDSIGLQKIEERDRQFLIEKISHGVEFSNQYENSIEKKKQKLLKLLKVLMEYRDVSTNISMLI